MIDVNALERRYSALVNFSRGMGNKVYEHEKLSTALIIALRQQQEALKEGDESLQMTANALREAEEALKEKDAEIARLRLAIKPVIQLHTLERQALEPTKGGE